MKKFNVDLEKCTGCGSCAKQCGFFNHVTVENKKAVYMDDLSNCLECFHCIKACPNGAITFNGKGAQINFEPNEYVSPVLKRRSCREYLDKKIEKSLLTDVINESNTAPRFDIEFDERKYLVVNDPEKLGKIRELVLSEMDKGRKFFSVLSKVFLLHKKKRDDYVMIADLLGNMLERNKTFDSLFYGAPALVMIAGEKSKTVSPDNSLYALGQLMIIAEEKGLSTCINGFVSLFRKAVGKHLGLDDSYKIYCAAVIGYPESTFYRTLVRDNSNIQWY